MKRLLASALLLLGAGILPSAQLESAGRRWTYYTASGGSATKPRPLVLLLHGAGGNGGGFLDRSGWADKAQTDEFVAVAPSGLSMKLDEPPDFHTNPRIWNVGLGLARGERAQIDDSEFILDLLGEVQRQQRIDSGRVYIVGHSNGAVFAYKLAVAYPHRFAAIAPVAGPVPPLLGKLRDPVPTYAIYGTEDRLLPLQGGEVQTPWGNRQNLPVGEMLLRWARAGNFVGLPQTVSEDEMQRTERYGPSLQVTYLKGHGHNYPHPLQPLVDYSFGPVRTEVPVNDLIWDFFKQHAFKPAATP